MILRAASSNAFCCASLMVRIFSFSFALIILSSFASLHNILCPSK
nr:MAG TPA: hypothetical protein [Caudoviricetes sp.]